jgi:hypothetical protein
MSGSSSLEANTLTYDIGTGATQQIWEATLLSSGSYTLEQTMQDGVVTANTYLTFTIDGDMIMPKKCYVGSDIPSDDLNIVEGSFVAGFSRTIAGGIYLVSSGRSGSYADPAVEAVDNMGNPTTLLLQPRNTATTCGGTLNSGGNFSVATNKFTVNATTGDTVVAGDLSVTGSFNPTSISTSGTINSGGNFSVATNKFTVNATTGDTVVAGDLSVTGSFNPTSISTSGTINSGGNFSVATNKFTVNATTGDTVAAGTLSSTGDFAVATNKFTVNATTGNTLVAGTLSSTGDFAVATNKFTVNATTGNTLVAGTLSSTGDFAVATNKFTVNATTGLATANNGLNVVGEMNVSGASNGVVYGNRNATLLKFIMYNTGSSGAEVFNLDKYGVGTIWSVDYATSASSFLGHVGVNTSASSAALTVQRADATSNYIASFTGTDGANFGVSVDIANTTFNRPIFVGSAAGTNRFYMNGDGRFGIGPFAGVTVPSCLLDIDSGALAEGTLVSLISQVGVSSSISMFVATGAAASAVASAISCRANSATSRSISAGGTINASGGDYAEYFEKREDCGIIAKGDICGIDTNGFLTDKWSNAHHFMIKSTEPSVVGNDVWGNIPFPARSDYANDEDYDAAKAIAEASLETQRLKMDRIAFCGQVPVNLPEDVMLTVAVGDYIIPTEGANDTITAITVSSIATFDHMNIYIGKILKIESGVVTCVVRSC